MESNEFKARIVEHLRHIAAIYEEQDITTKDMVAALAELISHIIKSTDRKVI